MERLQTKIDRAGQDMTRQVQKPIAEAIKEKNLAKQMNDLKQKEDAMKMREEMDKRKMTRLEEQMKQEEVQRKLTEALDEKSRIQNEMQMMREKRRA